MTIVVSPEAKNSQKYQAIAAWIVLGLPSLTATGFLWNSWREDQRRVDRDRLHMAFIEVLCQNGGYVTPLKLSVATGLDRVQAKAYIQARAKTLKGRLRVTKDGQVGYEFDLD